MFPQHNGEALPWSLGAVFTYQDELDGYPRCRAVIDALQEHRPDQLEQERRELIKSSLCDRLFGGNAKRLLKLIEEANGNVEAGR